MLCGMSSLFTQFTVVPAFTVNGVGENVKLSITTPASSAAATEARVLISTTTLAPRALRIRERRAQAPGFSMPVMVGPSACQWRVDDGQRRVGRHKAHARDAKMLFQLRGRNQHGARALGRTRRRLRERRRAHRVEGDVAFHLLYRLVYVPIQHGNLTELLQIAQCLRAI